MEPARAPVQRTDGIGQVSQIFDSHRGIVGRRHELDVAYRVLSPAQGAGGHRPLHAWQRLQAVEHRLGNRRRAPERDSWNRGAQSRQRQGDRRFDGFVEPRNPAKSLLLHGGGEVGH